MGAIDLRSDTVTRPTPAMREAMARAEVGDDAYGEDPTVQRLQERVADSLGKEAALFVPSGTMGNQIALLLHTNPGDEVLVGEGAHLAFFEAGAGAAIAGVQFRVLGQGGTFSGDDLGDAVGAPLDHQPRTSLVALENTHNRSGGRVFPEADVASVVAAARDRALRLHLDGARLWHASIASGRTLEELAAPFDTVNVCFSKGLGAPVGSALAGTRQDLARARRFRKRLGGGMRQAGVLAAAALYALEHHRERLRDDHEHARLLALELARAGYGVAPESVETNIVVIRLPGGGAESIAARAKQSGVLVGVFDARTLRLVTHLDVARDEVLRAAEVLAECRRLG